MSDNQTGPYNVTGAYRTLVCSTSDKDMIIDPFGFDVGCIKPELGGTVVDLLNQYYGLGKYASRKCPDCGETVVNGCGHLALCHNYGQLVEDEAVTDAH